MTDSTTTPTPPTPGTVFAGSRPPVHTARPVTYQRPGYPLPAQQHLPADAPFRRRYEVGIRYSSLHRNARLVALTLATWADWHTGLIPEQEQPGIPRIAVATGLGEALTRNSLRALIDAGWVRRVPAETSSRPSRTFLTIPDSAQAPR